MEIFNQLATIRLLAITLLTVTLVLLSLPGTVLSALAALLPFNTSLPPDTGFPTDKLVHASLFAACAWAVLQGWQGRVVLSVLFLGLFAAFTETVQYFVPGRSASFLDFTADCLGIFIVSAWLRYSRQLG